MSRHQINKLIRNHSTKSERRFAEILKELHIPFRTKVMIGKYEVDFLIGNCVVEIDGHVQNSFKNLYIISAGYDLIHWESWEITSPLIKEWFKKTWQEQR